MNVYKYLTCLIMNKLKMVKMFMGELGHVRCISW